MTRTTVHPGPTLAGPNPTGRPPMGWSPRCQTGEWEQGLSTTMAAALAGFSTSGRRGVAGKLARVRPAGRELNLGVGAEEISLEMACHGGGCRAEEDPMRVAGAVEMEA
jgi:hypothetical protein